MQRAEVILSLLGQKAKNDRQFVFRRLYRHLFNPDLYARAYTQVDSKLDHRLRIANVITRIKRETYYPASGQSRFKQALNWEDRWVQEAIGQILEAIYEPRFLDNSHGLRPHRSCHTALHMLRQVCRGTQWVIRGEIRNFFDHMDPTMLLALISRQVEDGRLLELIERFLKAGYGKGISRGFLQGDTVQEARMGAVLSNIYLHELDHWMQGICEKYNTGVDRRGCSPLNAKDGPPAWVKNVEIHYVRYAGDFLVAVRGSKDFADDIKGRMSQFLSQHLKLDLGMSPMSLTHLMQNKVRFLGYDMARSKEAGRYIEDISGVNNRTADESIRWLVPRDVIRKKMRPFVRNGKAVHHPARINLPIREIISLYDAEIRTLYDYYCMAADVNTKLRIFKYYHYYSLVKTLARKEKCSVKKIIDRYGIDVRRKKGTGTRRVVGVNEMTSFGEESVMIYFDTAIVYRPSTVCHHTRIEK